MAKKRALTGIRPSGNLHLGNYLGAIKPGIDLQNTGYECIYFIADMHSLTTMKDGSGMREFTYDIAAAWIAAGLNVQEHTLFRQSDVPQVAEFAWYLSSVTGFGYLEKAHAFKDAASQNSDVNHAVFAYPVLMAADIVMYDVDVVPVGKDQKQHVEMARNMAGSFNAAYKAEVMKLPEPFIHEEVMTIPGLDGRKMSKSYNNVIPIFCDEKSLRKTILSIKTDSTPLEAPKTLPGSLIGDLFKLFASSSSYDDLSKRLAAGGMGWGHAKEELIQVINQYVGTMRAHYQELRPDIRKLDRILTEGAEKAKAIADPVLQRVRNTVGFR